FFAAVSGVLNPDALRKAVADSVPPSFKDLNLKAFDKGYEYGLTQSPVFPEESESPAGMEVE
ncbi:MAG: pyruvate ferredoxin oxidoreductase, partial [Bryobacteraceae bacterium]|nr:pyruvate ferredoxin oxidoreductase [Bryobacteraceae bacterium]